MHTSSTSQEGFEVKASISHAAALERMLRGSPFSSDDIAAATGWHSITAARLLRSLHKRQLLHIQGWLPDSMGRDTTAVYAMGARRDKPKRVITTKERSHAYRVRKQTLRQQENIKGLFK